MEPSSNSTIISVTIKAPSSAILVESFGNICRIFTLRFRKRLNNCSSFSGSYSGFKASFTKGSYKTLIPFTPVQKSKNSCCLSSSQLSNIDFKFSFFLMISINSSLSRIIGKYSFNLFLIDKYSFPSIKFLMKN